MVDPKQHYRNLKQITKTIAEVEALVSKTSTKIAHEAVGSSRSRAGARPHKSSQKKK
jgi:hypothetical protein